MHSFEIAARPAAGARRRLTLAVSAATLIVAASLAGEASAADADAAAAAATTTEASSPSTGAGGEGSEVQGLVVTAEREQVTATAPTKGSLDETQPESIITRQFIEQATPEVGGWATVLQIAPSIAGIESNGGGIGDYQTVTMRGFQDGEFNITYDGIAFGDTNNPTHHNADYFPASTIGAVVVDRGPGAAGDLGQANFGGAIHFFSPTVSDTYSVVQKLTAGSFGTVASVTTLNTGEMEQLGGSKLMLNFDERYSNTELSGSNGEQYNQTAKWITPFGDKGALTLFWTQEQNYFHFEDSSGPGETWQQVETLGKNFSMNDNPLSEHFEGYNYEVKRTDFGYVDFKYQFTPSINVEDQAYTYWYSNKTHSTDDLTGVFGPNENFEAATGPDAVNSSPPKTKGLPNTDIGGYDKLNEYRVEGDIVRFDKDWSFGTLKVGGLIEGSRTFRHKCFVNDTIGIESPDDELADPPNSSRNCTTLEESSWIQGQVFADFYWHPTSNLTITPGFKYVDFTRNINATAEEVTGTPSKVGGLSLKVVPLTGSNNYQSPLYFLTGNYKITPYWSVYAQVATSFLIPELSDLYVTGINLDAVKPEYTTTYQTGMVYTRGAFTADADVYLVNATNLQTACELPDATSSTGVGQAFCNVGKARFDGVEGEAAYALPLGVTLFANGALNEATQMASPADVAEGILTPTPKEELPSSPLWTDAVGALYSHGSWRGSLTFKQVGTSVEYNTPIANGPQATFRLPSYETLNGSIGYVWPHFEVKLQAFNLTDARTINSFTPGSNSQRLFSTVGAGGSPDTGIYTFQAGRELDVTVTGRF
jgi:iron complex outermembrane recepter protein